MLFILLIEVAYSLIHLLMRPDIFFVFIFR
jgi:hypothetical protein